MSKNSENWYLGSSYIETIGFRRPAHKKGFFILWDTLMKKYDWKCTTWRPPDWKRPTMSILCSMQYEEWALHRAAETEWYNSSWLLVYCLFSSSWMCNVHIWAVGWSEKHKSWKMQKYWADSEQRHSTDFRTIFEIMFGWFVLCEFEQTCFTESGGSFGTL